MTQPAPELAPIVLDWSSAQNPSAMDLARAKREANVVGVIVRVESFSKVDAAFFKHAENVLKNELLLGAYAFQNTDDNPADEVKATLDALKALGAPLRLGLWNDVETLNNHSPTQTLVWDAGYRSGTEDGLGQPTGLYTGLNFWRSLGDAARADAYATRRLWLAQYGVAQPDKLDPWARFPDLYGPVLHQRWGNTIWRSSRTGEQRWGKACPGSPNEWRRIATAHDVPGCAGEVDCSQLPNGDLSRLLLF